MIQILIMTPSLTPHDAVTNDVLFQKKELLARGYQVFIYAEFCDDLLMDEVLAIGTFENMLQNKNNILIYHHSVGWDIGFRLLKHSKCKAILKYHNITPPE